MKFQSIQLLRAIAALMVLIFHSKIVFPHEIRDQLWYIPVLSDQGPLGVSLFFVISGFIVANVIDRPTFSFVNFFWRRLWRIAPLYWIVMLSALSMTYARNWFIADFRDAGIWGMLKSFLILPQQTYPFWPPGWSLEHEVIFYIIAAIIAPFFGLRMLAAAMVALAMTGFVFNFDWDYHLFSMLQLFFAAGVGAYLLRETNWHQTIPVATVALITGYLNFYKVIEINYLYETISFAIGFGALILALIDIERRGVKMPRSIVAIGDASYSLYLWHWLVIPLVSTIRDRAGFNMNIEVWRWVTVALSIGIALASYRWIEQPFIKFSTQKKNCSNKQSALEMPVNS